MATVVISSYNVASFPEGGGHFWVYLQYVLGLRQAGCEVFWLERLQKRANRGPEAAAVATFLERVKRFGLERNALLYSSPEEKADGEGPFEFLTVSSSEAGASSSTTDGTSIILARSPAPPRCTDPTSRDREGSSAARSRPA